MKRLILICFVAMIASTASAQSPPVLDAGWFYDQINGSFIDSMASPYLFNLTDPAYFRITDDFMTGDLYYVADFGAPVLITSYYVGAPTGWSDPWGWLHAEYSKGEVLLGIGPHSLTVQGDGAGGIPAGFYTQLETVPVPGAFLLGGIGLSLAAARLRGRKTL